jgi:hypothetical protein
MYDFAREALKKAMAEPLALERALGEYLSDPKPNVWFEHGDENGMFESVVLDRRTRMMYDAKHIFINGESYLAGGRDATLMRKLADTRPCRARIWQPPAMMRWSCCRRGLMPAGDWRQGGLVTAIVLTYGFVLCGSCHFECFVMIM